MGFQTQSSLPEQNLFPTEDYNLLTEQQAAVRLGLSIKTLQGWRWRGCGPRFLKLGRAVRYRISELDAFVEDGLRSSTSDRGVQR